MKNNSLQQITRIKLEELHKHYQKLNEYYNRIELQAEQTPNITQKLQILYEGLQMLTFGEAKIHPEVENFDVIWAEIEAESCTTEFLNYWLQKLKKEITQGRQRLEAGLVFGLVLEEFAFDLPKENIAISQQNAEKNWENIWETNSKADVEKFKIWVKEHLKNQKDFTKEFQSFTDKLYTSYSSYENTNTSFTKNDDLPFGVPFMYSNALFYSLITPEEVKQQLENISSHAYRYQNIKQEAKQALSNNSLITEITGALRIIHQNIESWHWKENEGQITSVWTQNKWRPFQYVNLLDTLFLEIVALRWEKYFKKIVFVPTYENKLYYKTIKDQRTETIENFFLIFFENAQEGYTNNASNARNLEDETTSDKLLGALMREIQYFQMRYKNEENYLNPKGEIIIPELFITHIDIKDFFLNISHDIMLEVLKMCGISGKYLDFFEKYLKNSYQLNEKTINPKKGIPTSNTLSMLLGDVLLKILQNGITHEKVFVYRQLDDIYIVSDESNYSEFALDYTKEFLEICGLEINPEKFGAIEIQKNPKIPNEFSFEYIENINQRPQWQFLELYADGIWRPNLPKIEKYKENMIAQIQHQSTIIDMIKSYNQHINYLLKGLAPAKEFGKEHYQAINKVLSEAFVHIFGKNQSIFDFLKSKITTRFPNLKDAVTRLPKSWFFFPITAGGLALLNPISQIAYLQKIQEKCTQKINEKQENEEAEQLLNDEKSWAMTYQYLRINNMKEVFPVSTLGMENLLRDFISRGGEVRGSSQTNLGTYWKWLIYTYGYEILDAFGTFRFLLTELIPLQAIYQNTGEL